MRSYIFAFPIYPNFLFMVVSPLLLTQMLALPLNLLLKTTTPGLKSIKLASYCSYKLREMVKTIVLGQDPPFYEKTGGLFMYPFPPPPKKMVSC